jgi:hypothetical protein
MKALVGLYCLNQEIQMLLWVVASHLNPVVVYKVAISGLFLDLLLTWDQKPVLLLPQLKHLRLSVLLPVWQVKQVVKLI